MAETGILLLLLLIASSLLSVSYADVEPSFDSNDPQVLNASPYEVITHNGGNDKWCNISLNGSDYIYTNNPYLAIANIVNSTECPSSENIYVNGKNFCIKESVTSLEVFSLHISTSVNISIPQQTGPFALRYFNAILLCPDSPESSFKITGDGDKKLPKLYISSGYVADPSPKDTCSLDLAIKEDGNVSVELAWSTLQTSTNISNFFTWNLTKQPFQNYTRINTTQEKLSLTFTKWSSNETNKVFVRISGSCSERPQIDNGTERNYDPNKAYGYLDTLYYECLDGYINASEKITCEGNGSWSLALCVRPEATTSTESTTSTEATTSTVSTTSTEATTSTKSTTDIEPTTGSKPLSTEEIMGIIAFVVAIAGGVVGYLHSVKAILTKHCGSCGCCTATSPNNNQNVTETSHEQDPRTSERSENNNKSVTETSPEEDPRTSERSENNNESGTETSPEEDPRTSERSENNNESVTETSPEEDPRTSERSEKGERKHEQGQTSETEPLLDLHRENEGSHEDLGVT